MVEILPEVLPLLIPIISLLIGGVIVSSIFIVHPLVRAITRVAEAHDRGAGRLPSAQVRELEERLASMEATLQRVIEEREFERALSAGEAHTPGTAGIVP